MGILFNYLLFIMGVLIYFLPSIICIKHHNRLSIFLINLLLGWTLIGWVIALAMAVNPLKK